MGINPGGARSVRERSIEYHDYGRETRIQYSRVGSKHVEQWRVNTVESEFPWAINVEAKGVKLAPFD